MSEADKIEDIKILENMRDNIYGAMQFEDDYQVSELEEKEFNALNLAIKALKERQEDREKIKELEEENRIQRRQLNSAFNNGWTPNKKIKEKFQNKRNQIFSCTYVDDSQWQPFDRALSIINDLEEELLGEEK